MAGSAGQSNVTGSLRFVLIALGAVLLFGSFAAALFLVLRNNGVVGTDVLAGWAGLTIAIGAVAAAMLWGMAGVLWLLEDLRRQARKTAGPMENLQYNLTQLEETLRTMPAQKPQQVHVPPVQGHGQQAAVGTGELVGLLRELRDLLLMSEAQRKVVSERHWGLRKDFLLAAFEKQMQGGDWNDAERTLEDLAEVSPGDDSVAQLKGRLEGQRTAHMLADVGAAQSQIRHLMSISAWAQAAQAAGVLAQRYPASAEAQSLQAEVMREKQALETEHVARLFQDITDSIEHRQWQRAVSLAEELLARYPGDRHAEKLRRDLPTLQENANALERKEQEELFKDLLKRQRYEEAMQVARKVIEKYPLSPVSVEMNRLLPRVEEMARAEREKRNSVTG